MRASLLHRITCVDVGALLQELAARGSAAWRGLVQQQLRMCVWAWLGPWQVGSEGVSELARSADLVIVNIAEPNGDTRVVLDGACRRTRGASAFHTVLESFPALAAIAISDGGRVCSLSLFRFAYS